MNLTARVGRRLVGPVAIVALSLGAAACGDDVADAPSDDPQAAEGQQLFTDNGCAACHSTSGETGRGPNLDGIYGEEVELEDGSTVTRDDEYLTRAISDPSAELVAGFGDQMPDMGFDDGEVEALVGFVRSLSD